MRHRIHLLTGDNDTGYICTFHSFCVSVLQEDSFAVQYPKSFLVLDNSDIDDMLRIIYAERGLTLRDMTFRAARDMIEIQKLFKKPDRTCGKRSGVSVCVPLRYERGNLPVQKDQHHGEDGRRAKACFCCYDQS